MQTLYDIKVLKENFQNFIAINDHTKYAEIISEDDIEGQKNTAIYKILYEEDEKTTQPQTQNVSTNDSSAVIATKAILNTSTTIGSVPSINSVKLSPNDIDPEALTDFESELNKLAEQKKKYGNDQQLIKEAVDIVNVLVVWRMLMSVPNFVKLFGVLSKWISKTFIAPFSKPYSEKGMVAKAMSTMWHVFNKTGLVWAAKLLGKIVISIIKLLKIPISTMISGFLLTIPSVNAKIKSKELTVDDIKQLADRVSLLIISVAITIIAPYSWGFQAAAATGNLISATVLKLDLEVKTGISAKEIIQAATEAKTVMSSVLTTVKSDVVSIGQEVWDTAIKKDNSQVTDTSKTKPSSSGVSDMDFAQFSQNVTIG